MQRKKVKEQERKHLEKENKYFAEDYAGEETKEFLREADKFDVEFPIPPQEKGMKPKHIKYLAVAAIVAVIILFSQTAFAGMQKEFM